MEGRPSLFQASSSGQGLSVQRQLASHRMKHQPSPPGEIHTFKKSPEAEIHTTTGAQDHGLWKVQGLYHYPLSIPRVVLPHLCSHRDQQAPLPLPIPSLPHELTCFPSQYPTVTIKFSLEPSFLIHTWLSVSCLCFQLKGHILNSTDCS